MLVNWFFDNYISSLKTRAWYTFKSGSNTYQVRTHNCTHHVVRLRAMSQSECVSLSYSTIYQVKSLKSWGLRVEGLRRGTFGWLCVCCRSLDWVYILYMSTLAHLVFYFMLVSDNVPILSSNCLSLVSVPLSKPFTLSRVVGRWSWHLAKVRFTLDRAPVHQSTWRDSWPLGLTPTGNLESN